MNPDDLNLRETGDGIEIPVIVRAGGRKNEIRGTRDGQLRVAVTQVAEKGKANDAVIALLAKSFGIAKSSIKLTRGSKSTKKTFEISNISKAELIEKLKVC